jgi:hypothetical protein
VERGPRGEADAEKCLLHAIVELAGDAVPLVFKQTLALKYFEPAVQLLQTSDDLTLLRVQARIVQG